MQVLQGQKLPEPIASSYKFTPQVKVIINFPYQSINSSNYFILAQPHCTIMDLRQELLRREKLVFCFFINNSFMPALDSKVGDLAFCYGREEVEKESGKGIYTIKMVCCQNQNQYG